MSLQSFLKQQEQKKEKKKGKKDFRGRCLDLLAQIQKVSESKYSELHKIFSSRFDKPNIQKKKILGFYGQLKDELRKLQTNGDEQVLKTVAPIKRVKVPSQKISSKTPKANKSSTAKKKAKKKTVKKSPNKKKSKKKVAKKAKKKVVKKTKKKASKKTKAKKKQTKKKTSARKRAA